MGFVVKPLENGKLEFAKLKFANEIFKFPGNEFSWKLRKRMLHEKSLQNIENTRQDFDNVALFNQFGIDHALCNNKLCGGIQLAETRLRRL